MNNSKEKKKLIYKIIFIFIVMVFLIFTFFWMLITLSNLEQIILKGLIAVLWCIFIYLGARLLLAITQMYSNSFDIRESDDLIEKHVAKTVVVSELEDKLIRDGFDKVEIKDIKKNYEFEIHYLQRIIHNKGAYIEEFYLLNDVIYLETAMEVIEWIQKESNAKITGLRNTVIRQKCVFLCMFCNKKNNVDIIKFISKFNFTFTVILPIFIDIEDKEVYYKKIPIDKRFAKGKALVNAQQIVLKYLI